jgi:glycosyltransferase involved in cell wall biosynthesis
MRLLIISDTYMFEKDGTILAYAPVVKELQSFDEVFQHITFIGMEDRKRQQNAVLEITSKNVEPYILPQIGGNSVFEKLKVLFYLPILVIILSAKIRKHDVIHTRGPCYPAYVAVWLSWLFQKKIWWNKFATNWHNDKSSFAFRLHKVILIKSIFAKTTINGNWPDLPAHVLPFENPCLSDEQIEQGNKIVKTKQFIKPFRLVFIGNIETTKGIYELFKALQHLDGKDWISLEIIGNGSEMPQIVKLASMYDGKVIIHGSIHSDLVHSILSKAHFLLLPSYSEGFPKVIAEAACWGCIPVVSAVGSIPQYVKDGENGFLWNLIGEDNFGAILEKAVNTSSESLKKMSRKANDLSSLFTFERYAKRIKKEVLS